MCCFVFLYVFSFGFISPLHSFFLFFFMADIPFLVRELFTLVYYLLNSFVSPSLSHRLLKIQGIDQDQYCHDTTKTLSGSALFKFRMISIQLI